MPNVRNVLVILGHDRPCLQDMCIVYMYHVSMYINIHTNNMCVYINYGFVMFFKIYTWMFPKMGVPKMDGENNGKPYFLMDDLGFSHYFWFNTYIPIGSMGMVYLPT